MNLFGRLFCSSIGRKFLMAFTGLVLVGFAFGHLVGNLQIFAAPDKINGYAHFLQSLGPVLWVVRGFLLTCVAIHIWAAVVLTLENKRARGPEAYGVNKFIQATVQSRYMRMTGVVVLAFLVYHIAHFTIGAAGSGTFKTNFPDYRMAADFHLFGLPVALAGTPVHDVYSMMFLGFANPFVSIFYILAVGLLAVHLWHGIDSMFQTVGWRNARWSAFLQKLAALFCLFYFLGNLVIPGAILTGLARPEGDTEAARRLLAATPASHVAQR